MPKIKKAKIEKQSYKNGIKTPTVSTGKPDIGKINRARKISKQNSIEAASSNKTAGTMMNYSLNNSSNHTTSSLGAYYTSYANGLNTGGGTRDVPAVFVAMNEANGSPLYWPITLREKFELYRYFCRSDAYCGRAMELLTDLPMSKISLNMPKMEDQPKELKEEIYSFYDGMIEEIGLFKHLQSIIWESNVIGNCTAFHQWCDKRKTWEKLMILPPEEVSIFHFPFDDGNARIEWRPERLMAIIKDNFGENGTGMGGGNEDLMKEIYDKIPKEMIDMITEHNCIRIDSDPYSGSFAHHISRFRSAYQDLGASVMERVYVPMLMKEHYRYTQLGLASRNMTPKNKLTAAGADEVQLEDLRMQLDLSYLQPEYSIVTNYDFQWDQIGAGGRLLELGAEYETIENQIFAGLGVTRELLTGEGVYSGNKITIEILNTMFTKTRTMLQDYVENQLFKPVAEAHGWFKVDKHGYKKYFYPKLNFNRLSIRDNQEVFDSLFQLYQKGSLPIDIIYELFNLNVDSIHDSIYSDLMTVKDPTFNRVLDEMGAAIGQQLVEKTDVLPRICKYLRLHMTDEEGNRKNEIFNDSEILTPSERVNKDRAIKKEKQNIHNKGDISKINSEDIDDVANMVVEKIDPNISKDDLKKQIDQSVEEILK